MLSKIFDEARNVKSKQFRCLLSLTRKTDDGRANDVVPHPKRQLWLKLCEQQLAVEIGGC